MHAYLIMAHKNLKQMCTLLQLLDDSRNDIFIHIDAKASLNLRQFNYQSICKSSKVFMVRSQDVRWGSLSQIECEIYLLKFARKIKCYEYYHLLSGADLPLRSQDYIHKFFDENKGKEFIHIRGNVDRAGKSICERTQFYWHPEFYHSLPIKKSWSIMWRADHLVVLVQRMFRINRNKNINFEYVYGSNWFSITDELANALINEETNIENIYHRSLCCDEVFLQTFVYNSAYFRDKLYCKQSLESANSTLRYIDWKRAQPYTWHSSDFNELINSGCLFARKFDETIDNLIIMKIRDFVMNNSRG